MIMDPSKLKADVVSKLWRHWLERQESDMQGLIFIKSQPGDMREKVVKKGKKGGKDYVDPEDSADDNAQNDGGAGDQGRGAGENDGVGNGEGGSKLGDDPHPLSPFVQSGTEVEREEFLRGLSSDPVYKRFMSLLPMMAGVRSYFYLQNPPFLPCL